MIYVGIDIASTKHDCFITNEHGEVFLDSFTIENNYDGFTQLREAIKAFSKQTNDSKISNELSEGEYAIMLSNHINNSGEKYHLYYLKKKAEGLHHNKILGHIGKKFLRLLYSILKDNSKYQKSYQMPLTTI